MQLIEGVEIIGAIMVQIDRPFFIYRTNDDGSKTLDVVPHDQPNPFWYLAILPMQTPVTALTLPDLMVKFDEMGFIMPEKDVWDYPEKPLRIILSDSDVVNLFKIAPEFMDFIDSFKEFTIPRNGNQYIYLEEVYPQHDAVLKALCLSYVVEQRN